MARIAKLHLEIEQRGELCRVSLDGGKLRYGGPESKYHLVIWQKQIGKDPTDFDDDPICSWTFPGIPRVFSLGFPSGHSPNGRYTAHLIDDYWGNDSASSSNEVIISNSDGPYTEEIPN